MQVKVAGVIKATVYFGQRVKSEGVLTDESQKDYDFKGFSIS